MESHIHISGGSPIKKPRDTPVQDMYLSFSDPEDDDTSSEECFNEDDIYDGSDNGDEIIYPLPDLEAESPDGVVCPPLTQGVHGTDVT